MKLIHSHLFLFPFHEKGNKNMQTDKWMKILYVQGLQTAVQKEIKARKFVQFSCNFRAEEKNHFHPQGRPRPQQIFPIPFGLCRLKREDLKWRKEASKNRVYSILQMRQRVTAEPPDKVQGLFYIFWPFRWLGRALTEATMLFNVEWVLLD